MSAVIVDLQRRIADLEGTVRQLTQDKEALYRDLESQLVRSEDSFWSSSSVLADRLTQAEAETARLQGEVFRLSAERNSFREDSLQIHLAKRASDEISKSEMEKSHALERELTFYKKQCARALEDRNLFAYEVEELKKTNLEVERQLQDVGEKLEIEGSRREEREREGQELIRQVAHLEERLTECARIPELESQLHHLRHQKSELQSNHNKLQSVHKVLQNDMESAWQMVDQTNQEKEVIKQQLEEAEREYDASLELERRQNIDLQRRLDASDKELAHRTSELRDADSMVAAAQAEAELFQESRKQQVDEQRLADRKKIARLEIELEETEGLLSRKMTELKAAVEAKITAQENASEWESKWLTVSQRVKELEKIRSGTPPALRRLSMESSSFTNGKGDRRWFRLGSRKDAESYKTSNEGGESMTKALDLVLSLVPKLKDIHKTLESAEPSRTGSRRESLSRLEDVKMKTGDLQRELEAYPVSPHLDDEAGRLSAHVKIGMEAVRLAFYGIARLKQFIDVVH